MRRRNHRIALGKLTSSWRSASAAASMLPYAVAAQTAVSIELSSPGNLTQRKSGRRLKVRRPSGQYQRATRMR
jgi:hypothetical protein